VRGEAREAVLPVAPLAAEDRGDEGPLDLVTDSEKVTDAPNRLAGADMGGEEDRTPWVYFGPASAAADSARWPDRSEEK
jgi:hypothetical protein